MVSRKRTFQDDDAANGVLLSVSPPHKVAKTHALARANAATIAPATITVQVEQLSPTAPVGRISSSPVPASASASASAPLSISKSVSDDENEGPSKQPSYPSRKDKGKRPVSSQSSILEECASPRNADIIRQASRDPPDTATDLYKKELWRIEWEKESKEKFLMEMIDAARSELECRWESEKMEWEAEAIRQFDEQIEAMKQWFQPQIKMALEEAQKAKVDADNHIELSTRIWADLQTKQVEVNFLQARLSEINTYSTDVLAIDIQSNATALLNQKDLEIERLVAESTKAKSDVENSDKARQNAVKEVANHAEEIKNLEERLEVVRGVNRDLYTAGVEKTQKIHQLEKTLEGAQSLSQASQKLAKESKELDGESQAPTRDQNATNELNVDEQLLKETIAKSKRDEFLVDALKRKMARQANESEAELKKLKMEMTAGLKEALEEKEKVVRELKKIENAEELMNDENQILKRRNKEMKCKALKDASEIARLNTQIKRVNASKQYIINENLDLKFHTASFKRELLAESKLLEDANSQITELKNKNCLLDFQRAKTVRELNWEIKTLKKSVRTAESTIFTLRQWDAESGVTERDEIIKKRNHTIKTRDNRIEQLEKYEKKCLDHIEKLQREIFEQQNVGLIGKLSRWIFGTRLV